MNEEQKNWTKEDWDAYYAFLADEDAKELEAMEEYVQDYLEMEADY